jgi:dehydrogenase/reductase SDR family member 1
VAAQLADDHVTSVAVYLGLVRSEGVMQFADYFDLTASQSPQGVGRAIAADPQAMPLGGRALYVGDLADRYQVDITD